jgi:curved DNA-binding protein CbpA
MTRPSARPLLLSALFLVSVAAPASALFCGSKNCYELLGVPRTATKSEIRRAYRRISVEKHPDKRPGDEAAAAEFRAIGDAYGALKDDAKRAKYDDFLDSASQPRPRSLLLDPTQRMDRIVC